MPTFCTRVNAPVLLAFLAALFLAAPLFARQEGALVLSAGRLGQGVNVSDIPWRYHPGENPRGADPMLDDTGWRLVAPDFPSDSVDARSWPGIGWFRLHLRVDSTLHNALLALSIYHAGASEVYFDGQRLGGFGEIGAEAGTDLPFSPKGLPLAILLDDRAEHVLAVRYANRSTGPRLPEEMHPYGFAVVLAPLEARMHGYVYAATSYHGVGLIEGILLFMAFLHFLLYAFDRRDRSNLYFGLFSLFGVATLYCGGIINHHTLVSTLPTTALVPVNDGVALGMSLFLMATLHALYYNRLYWTFWVLAFFLCGVYLADLIGWGPHLSDVFFLVSMLEGIRVVVRALLKKETDAWILAVGILSMLIIAVVFSFMASSLPEDFLRMGFPEQPVLGSYVHLILAVFYLSVPVAMSVLLARRFVQRSRRLERELERVEALSAQTLAQEREKQALVAGQNERLEAQVAERTAELNQSLADLKATQAQLVQQEKLASLGQLTAGIAHEIKNPLNFVNNFAEVNEELADELDEALRNGGDPQAILADLKQNAQVIAQHGRRADAIVRSMMQHAAGSTGRREPTEVNALVEEHLDLAYHGKRATLPGFTVDIRRDFDDAVETAELMPQEIGRVVLNLLSNAFDAVHAHAASVNGTYTPVVTVSTRRLDGRVEIRVSDNGPGIPAGLQEKIFEPFFTTKPTGSGTGLGLSLSYDIVVQGHGGTLVLESETGRGATFIVALPLHRTSVH